MDSVVTKKEPINENAIPNQYSEVENTIHLAVFGHGLVGGALIDQILASTKEIKNRKGFALKIFAVANSKKAIFNREGVQENWREDIQKLGVSYKTQDVIAFAKEKKLRNLIAIDNTASQEFVGQYFSLVEGGFHLVSSNKIANTIGFDYYQELREKLALKKKNYLYETNVGAGLPLIDTIKLLHLSGENITRIRGVFSGSLSYLFNEFSAQDKLFSEVLEEAICKGFTEPDPREDLGGNDVARKLLVLARELDLHNEMEDVEIENLIPTELQSLDVTTFLQNTKLLDYKYQEIKDSQKPNSVLRYIGDLSGDLSKVDGASLQVKLVSVPSNSSLGGLKESDSIFEIYTESYGEHPLVIQGAGAGAKVTARGVFGDILRLAETNLVNYL